MGKLPLQELVFSDLRNHRAGTCLVNRIKHSAKHRQVVEFLDNHYRQLNHLGAYLVNLILHPTILVEDFCSKINNNSNQVVIFLEELLNHLEVISSNLKETLVLVLHQLNNKHHCLA